MSPSGDEESRWQCSTVALSSPWGSTGGAGLAMTALGVFQLEHTWSTLEEHLKGWWTEFRWQWKPLRWNPGGAETPVGRAKWSPTGTWRRIARARWSPNCAWRPVGRAKWSHKGSQEAPSWIREAPSWAQETPKSSKVSSKRRPRRSKSCP